MQQNIKKILSALPHKPGVYLFRDKNKKLLYAGKAKKLKNRVQSYFQEHATLTPAKRLMVNNICDIEYTVTDTENEALLLETSLIKKYKPPYNVMLKDDKYWQYIAIDRSDTWVQFYTVRRPDFNAKKLATYFGPYTSGHAVKQALRLIKKLFPVCVKLPQILPVKRPQPCFNYHLKRCLGPCVGAITPQEYATTFNDIKMFLTGNRRQLTKKLENDMRVYSQRKQYEAAARTRDQLKALKKLDGRQNVVLPSCESFDSISIYRTDERIALNVFKIRFGKLLDKFNTVVSSSLPNEDVLSAFIEQYYTATTDIPTTIITGYNLGELTSINDIPIKRAYRGKKAQLIKLGSVNALEYLKQQETFFDRSTRLATCRQQALQELALELSLPKPPQRIETYDISNIQGTSAVGAMVVFEQGIPQKSGYRIFTITTTRTPDDVHMMYEVLMRRLQHLGNHANTTAHDSFTKIPNLIVVDGGIAQLNIARRALKYYKLSIPVIALAKREEEVYVSSNSTPLRLPRSSHALQLLQHARDEAHRFGITHHRKKHTKASLSSILDTIPGVGDKTKTRLLKKYKSIASIQHAPQNELTTLIGSIKAQRIKRYIN